MDRAPADILYAILDELRSSPRGVLALYQCNRRWRALILARVDRYLRTPGVCEELVGTSHTYAACFVSMVLTSLIACRFNPRLSRYCQQCESGVVPLTREGLDALWCVYIPTLHNELCVGERMASVIRDHHHSRAARFYRHEDLEVVGMVHWLGYWVWLRQRMQVAIYTVIMHQIEVFVPK